MKKGQASIEVVLLIGVFLVMLGVVFVSTSIASKDGITLAKLQKATDQLAGAADQVTALGPGSSVTIAIELPENVQRHFAQGGVIGFDVNTSAGTTAVYSNTIIQSSVGGIPLSPGVHLVTLRLLSNGSLLVGSGFYAQPASENYTFGLGGSQSKNFTLFNKTQASVNSITSTVSGVIAGAGWTVTVSGLGASLAVDANDPFTVLVDADSTIAGGTYTGSVAVNGTNAATGLAEQTTISVTVVVTTTSSSCNLTAGTYSDLLCVVPNNTFIQGATLYVKAKTDNCTITDGVITLKRPSGSTTSASGLTVDSIAGVCEDFLLATNDETGTWSAQASSVSGAANAAQSSFSVEDDCNLVVSTHSDSLCAVSDASFTENDNVYVKVTITVGCTATDVDVDVREPDNDSARQWNNQTISVVAPFCDNYKIKQNDPLGTWSAAATSDQAADQSSTFSVT